ncbi:hypothetical protein BIM11_6194 [Burkholderia pseudomallei]|nr:hypothetical protein BIM11_6194 [Burkholderia pseudomallei]
MARTATNKKERLAGRFFVACCARRLRVARGGFAGRAAGAPGWRPLRDRAIGPAARMSDDRTRHDVTGQRLRHAPPVDCRTARANLPRTSVLVRGGPARRSRESACGCPVRRVGAAVRTRGEQAQRGVFVWRAAMRASAVCSGDGSSVSASWRSASVPAVDIRACFTRGGSGAG